MINIEPIGIVRSDFKDPHEKKVSKSGAVIEIYPQYSDALLRLGEHSHIWVLGWFHAAVRNVLRVRPRINLDLPEYGVFGMRSPSRPNPVGLTVTKLEAVEDNLLYVQRLDFIDGTPIIDIKPYFEQDIIFSPRTPYIKPKEALMLEEIMMKEALYHHQEECPPLLLGIKMCLAAERELGQLTASDVVVSVTGPSCLADTVQGLTRARLANPPRFSFHESGSETEVRWQKGSRQVIVRPRSDLDLSAIKEQSYAEVLEIVTL
jgi:tRNA-Thr(GGU) m(6)t(6)A37 methyltransferase TsaA